MNLAFCPSVSELSFLALWFFLSLSGGCSLVGEVVVFDLEANLFLQCSPVVKSIFLDLEARVFCFPYGGCSHLSEVGVVDLEANLFLTVLSFEKNRCF